MKRFARLSMVLVFVAAALVARAVQEPGQADEGLRVGFGEADITPTLGSRPVYMAGFGHNRIAAGIHDHLYARAIVIEVAGRRIALVSVDVVGLFRDQVQAIRKRLPGFEYVLVSSTHNHEGPDTMGLWGANLFVSGVDAEYMATLQQQATHAVEQAATHCAPATAEIGAASAPDLVRDSREPYVKHDELTAIRFREKAGGKTVGTIVGWNCHPETLDSRNTEVSADFVGYTVQEVREKTNAPVLYLTGTVGGLMTSLGLEVRDAGGQELHDGTFAKTERYGRLVGELAMKALFTARPLAPAPLEVRSREVYLPLYNRGYQLGRTLGVLKREAHIWTGDPYHAPAESAKDSGRPLAVRTEIGWIRLGQLEIAAIPGEIYPELVLGKVQDPADPGADFPDAPKEQAIYAQLKSPHRLIIGLANDELGYIIPKRQWDEKPPFCYGRKKKQYGEENSVGPETAPILCEAFAKLAAGR